MVTVSGQSIEIVVVERVDAASVADWPGPTGPVVVGAALSC
jgi:hypothetical protein